MWYIYTVDYYSAIKGKKCCPGQLAQLAGVPSHTARECGFSPRSGPIPRFDFWLGCMWEATSQCFSLTSMFLSLSSSLSKINKRILGWGFIKNKGALTSVTQSVGHHPAKWKVASSIPGEGHMPGMHVHPWPGHIGEATDQCLSLTSMFLPSPSPSLPLSLKINKIFFYKRVNEVLINTTL